MTWLPRRLGRVRIVAPLRHRDVALRTARPTVSLLGDGFRYVVKNRLDLVPAGPPRFEQ